MSAACKKARRKITIEDEQERAAAVVMRPPDQSVAAEGTVSRILSSKRKREPSPAPTEKLSKRQRCTAIVVRSTEERAERDKRKKAIQEFCKTWIKAKEEEVKEQRSATVRKSMIEQEKQALRACIQRVKKARQGFDDVHTIIALLRALIRMYHTEGGEDVSKIATLRVDRDRVLAKGRQGFLRELYGMAREKSSVWAWPKECSVVFQRELKECFEAIESGTVTDREQMMTSIAQDMMRARERIVKEYESAKERERQQSLVTMHAPPPSRRPLPTTAAAAYGGCNGSYQQVTYRRVVTVISFTKFMSNGATAW